MNELFRPGILFHDLRRGYDTEVPGSCLDASLLPSLESAIVKSSGNRAGVRVEGTPFRVQADLREIHNGNGYFAIDVAAEVAGGKISAGARLCTGITCATLATAPAAWRWLLNRYLRYVARAPHEQSTGSFGGMSQAVPWVQFYSTQALDSLTADEAAVAERLLHTLGLLVLSRAQQAVHEAVRAGRDFRPDPREYPELGPDFGA